MRTPPLASHRFGLGARPDERVQSDPRQWLLAQLDAQTTRPPPWQKLPSTADLTGVWLDQQRAVRQAPEGQRAGIREAYLRRSRGDYLAAIGARVDSALQTQTPFVEHLVHFWANHFAVSVDKLLVIGLAGATDCAVGGGEVLADKLAQAISRACPHARILLLPAAPQAHDLRDIHVLIALGPSVNLLAARHRRADLLVVAWAASAPDVRRWQRRVDAGATQPFDACLARSSAALQAALEAGFPSCRSTPDEPLGYLLTRRMPLRLGVMPAAQTARSARRAGFLVAALRAQGALAHLHDARRPRLAEVVLHLGRATEPLPGCVNLLCMPAQRRESSPRPGFHGVLGNQPALTAVHAVWESVVGPLVPAP